MRHNLKNFNHWISEIREIARKECRTDEDDPLDELAIMECFNKESMREFFVAGLSPQQAFAESMVEWDDGDS